MNTIIALAATAAFTVSAATVPVFWSDIRTRADVAAETRANTDGLRADIGILTDAEHESTEIPWYETLWVNVSTLF